MFYSTCLTAPLLVIFVQMASTEVLPPGCDLGKLRNIRMLNASRFRGIWYMKALSTKVTGFANLDSYIMDVTTFNISEYTLLNFVVYKSYTTDQLGCIEEELECCYLWGATCSRPRPNFELVFQIIAIDYDSVMASWFKIGSKYALALYARHAIYKPDMSSIQPLLQHFCGAEAADPTSDFYAIKFSYDYSPCDP